MEDIVLDKSIEDQIEHLMTEQMSTPRVPIIGIVIGSSFRRTLTAVHLAPCPKPEPLVGDVIEEISEDDLAKEKEVSETRQKKKKKTVPTSLKLPLLSEYIDENWILDHARKLWRCLPGGLSMIGLFFIGEKRARSELNNVLMRGLNQLPLENDKARRLMFGGGTKAKDGGAEGRVLLSLELPGNKPTMSMIDSAGSLHANARFTYQTTFQNTRWIELSTTVTLDVTNAVTTRWGGSRDDVDKDQIFELTFLSAIRPFCTALPAAHGLLNGHIKPPDDSLAPADPPSRRKGAKVDRDRDQLDTPHVKVDLLLPPTLICDRELHPTGSSAKDQNPKKRSPADSRKQSEKGGDGLLSSELSNSVVTLRGTMACRAFVPRKATVNEGLDALKLDIVRSLMARCRLHSEGLYLLDPDQGELEQLHQLPRRAFAPLTLGCLSASEYAFEGDLPGDLVDTLRHTLSLPRLRESALDMEHERVLDYENMLLLGLAPPVSREGSTVSGHSSDQSLLDAAATGYPAGGLAGTATYVAVIVAAVVAMLGIGAYFVMVNVPSNARKTPKND